MRQLQEQTEAEPSILRDSPGKVLLVLKVLQKGVNPTYHMPVTNFKVETTDA